MEDSTIVTGSAVGKHLDAIAQMMPVSYLVFNKKKIKLVAQITIGRDRDNSIVLDNKLVSRHHAMIQKIKDAYFLKDLMSTNGTYINNKSFNFTNIVRSDNKYPSLFGYIFNILQKKPNVIDNIFNILNAFNNMLNKEEVKDIDKASMLLPLFIENNTINNTKDDNNTLDKKEVEDKDKKTYKTLFDELLGKYSSENKFKEIFKNIFEKAKEYLPDDYLSKSSYYKKILETKESENNTVAELSDENVKTEGKTGNDYSSELPDSTVSKEKEKTKNNNSSQESKLLSKDKETKKESQNQNKLSNENLKTKEEQKNQTTIAIENYSSQKLELPHSGLLDKSSNKGEKIEEQPEIKNESQKIIRWKSGKISGQYIRVIEEVSRNKTENKQSDNNNELLEKLKKRKKIVDEGIEQNITLSTLSVQTQPYVTNELSEKIERQQKIIKGEKKSNEKIPDAEYICTKLREEKKKFKGNSK